MASHAARFLTNDVFSQKDKGKGWKGESGEAQVRKRWHNAKVSPKMLNLPEQEQEVAGPTSSFTSDFVPMSLSQPEMSVLKSAPLREQFQ